jgi:hypothetical protein
MGGRDSTKCRRELYCEWVVDETRAVVPEFNDERSAIMVHEVDPPTYETPLVSLDVGFEDYSHLLFGYYNFKTAHLVIQAEARLRRMRTDQLAAEVKRVEAELWTGYAPKPSRVSDVDLILLQDLGAIHGLHFAPIAKDEKEAMVNELRLWVQSHRLEIDPGCEFLVRQMKSAIWNKSRTSFERTPEDGHFDGVDALIYMLRSAPIHHNPYPAFPAGVTPKTHTVLQGNWTDDQTTKAMRTLFPVKKRRRYGTFQ